jgi:hypothetical protein
MTIVKNMQRMIGMPEFENPTESKARPQIPIYQPTLDEKWVERRLGKTKCVTHTQKKGYRE